ncbi:MAG: DUF3027 domain-containing protein [Actinomycetaceae bacterium]|nr:DUF3027 domain-containing protein [Actinomycetaceae bacterium]
MPDAATKARVDATLAAAVTQAHDAAVAVAGANLGEHLGFRMDAERLGTHSFACTHPGYIGWCWAVSVARAPRSRKVTICEVDLVPGDGALLAPEWVPWEERLQPGDYARDDVIPYRADDERLDQAMEDTSDDPDVLDIPEVGLGRARVLSAEGIGLAVRRWYRSDQGPARGRLPKNPCSTCGFLVKMSGSMRTIFGVCANEWAQDDGRVVSLDHTCGAHSETDIPSSGPEWSVRPSRINDFVVEAEKMPAKDEDGAQPA